VRFLSVTKDRVHKHRAERVHAADERVIDVAEALAGNEARGAADDQDVVVEPRTVFAAEAQIGADVVGHIALEDKRLQHFGLVEPEEVDVADEPELSDFYFPTVMRRGTLQIAVSTGGNSLALEERLCEELHRLYGPEYEGWIEWLGKARASIFADPLSPRRRKTLLRKLASERGLEEFMRRRGMSTAGENR